MSKIGIGLITRSCPHRALLQPSDSSLTSDGACLRVNDGAFIDNQPPPVNVSELLVPGTMVSYVVESYSTWFTKPAAVTEVLILSQSKNEVCEDSAKIIEYDPEQAGGQVKSAKFGLLSFNKSHFVPCCSENNHNTVRTAVWPPLNVGVELAVRCFRMNDVNGGPYGTPNGTMAGGTWRVLSIKRKPESCGSQYAEKPSHLKLEGEIVDFDDKTGQGIVFIQSNQFRLTFIKKHFDVPFTGIPYVTGLSVICYLSLNHEGPIVHEPEMAENHGYRVDWILPKLSGEGTLLRVWNERGVITCSQLGTVQVNASVVKWDLDGNDSLLGDGEHYGQSLMEPKSQTNGGNRRFSDLQGKWMKFEALPFITSRLYPWKAVSAWEVPKPEKRQSANVCFENYKNKKGLEDFTPED